MNVPPISAPPVGLRPAYIAIEQRLTEIREAVYRYLVSGEDIPDAWIIEWCDLIKLEREIGKL